MADLYAAHFNSDGYVLTYTHSLVLIWRLRVGFRRLRRIWGIWRIRWFEYPAHL
jgi:hypothetical protein